MNRRLHPRNPLGRLHAPTFWLGSDQRKATHEPGILSSYPFRVVDFGPQPWNFHRLHHCAAGLEESGRVLSFPRAGKNRLIHLTEAHGYWPNLAIEKKEEGGMLAQGALQKDLQVAMCITQSWIHFISGSPVHCREQEHQP